MTDHTEALKRADAVLYRDGDKGGAFQLEPPDTPIATWGEVVALAKDVRELHAENERQAHEWAHVVCGDTSCESCKPCHDLIADKQKLIEALRPFAQGAKFKTSVTLIEHYDNAAKVLAEVEK